MDLGARRAASARVAADAGWQRLSLSADPFVLAAFVPPLARAGDALTVYLEGDGLAWLDAGTPSEDPTPLEPLALRLALRDAGPVAYLARPCQYVAGAERRGCTPIYWTTRRFAPDVVRATSAAIDQLKARSGATRLVLVGYSGGGVLAALVAAARSDVARLVTIAAPLDQRAWTRAEGLAPLTGSLNPADEWEKLRHLPQMHYVGGRDRIVGATGARAFAARFPPGERPPVEEIPEFDHHCCWVERWPALECNAGCPSLGRFDMIPP